MVSKSRNMPADMLFMPVLSWPYAADTICCVSVRSHSLYMYVTW